MGTYTLYQIVDSELYENTAMRAVCESMLADRVVGEGLTPTGPMRYSWSEHFPLTVDPYEFLPWRQRVLVRARLLPRPRPYAVRQFGLRGVVEVAEDGPEVAG